MREGRMAKRQSESRREGPDGEIGHIAASQRMIREAERSMAITRDILRQSREAIEESRKKLQSKGPGPADEY